MEKILFVYTLIKKQKQNNQKPSRLLNIGLSVGFIVLILVFTGRDIIGFMLVEKVNGKDIVGILGLTYGILNLLFSYKYVDEFAVVGNERQVNDIIVDTQKQYEFNILPLIKYNTATKNNEIKEVPKEITHDKSTFSDVLPTDLEEETPTSVLEEQLNVIEQNPELFEDVPENALTIEDKKKELKSFLEQLL